MLGKKASELQSNVVVSDDAITGTLFHVNDYVGFSSNVSEQKGNYLALQVITEPQEGVTTTVELVGGTKGPVTLDEDMNIVIRVTDPKTQKVKVISTKGEKSTTKVYNLTGLVLNPEIGADEVYLDLSNENDEEVYAEVGDNLYTVEKSGINETVTKPGNLNFVTDDK